MYLDPEDKEKVIEYLSKNKKYLISLKSIEQLTKMKDKLYKKYDSSFYDEIDVQYYNSCKLVIAEDIGRVTGLGVDGIMFIMDSMGLDNFIKYMKPRKKRVKKV